jgi:hypothetical protein
MGHKRAEALLNQINATLAERRQFTMQTEKRIIKAPNQRVARALRSELEKLHAQTEVLKVQQKALKRGIVPGGQRQ